MKTIKSFSAALFVLAAISCNTENLTEPTDSALEPMYISGTATKTVFTPADGSVSWTAGDQLAIFDNQGGKNVFNNSEAAAASFSGEVTVGTTKFWGIYPADKVVSQNTKDGKVVVNLPADQTPVAGTFAEDVNISVTTGDKTPGVASVKGITFHNVCGLVSFTVPQRVAAKKVTFTASNRCIAGQLSVDCEDSSVEIIGNESQSVSMTGDFQSGSTFYFVVTPGEIKGFRIDVETNAGSQYYLGTNAGVLDIVAGGYVNIPDIDLKDGEVRVSASHTYSNGVLTGTSLTVNHGIPSQLWKDVTNLTLYVTKDGKEYRSYNGSVNAASVTPEGKDGVVGKVYLPQGTYQITGSYTMNGVTKNISTTAELEAPEFKGTATVTGTTSYSIYHNNGGTKNPDGANNHAAEMISDISASCPAVANISSEVLKEIPVNYSITLGTSELKKGTTTSTDAIEVDDETGNSWGQHTLLATFTFDGVAIQGSTVCHITGLPYTANPPKNSGNYLWSSNFQNALNTIDWGSSEVHLEGISRKALITSPAFQVPANIGVKLIVSTQMRTMSVVHVYAQSHLICRVSGNEVINRYGTKGEKDWKGSSNNIENFTGTGTGTLTSSNSVIEVENEYSKTEAYIKVKSVTLQYN